MTLATDALEQIDKALDAWIPETLTAPGLLHEAMRYSIFAGGKRLRPRLALASCSALGGDPLRALPAAAALEMIHTYSLIHDDLPAMDDDDLRRGRPTNHKVYGEDMAILAGDALLTQAFVVLAEESADPDLCAATTGVIARASGSLGMVGGQVADIKSEDKEGTMDLLKFIHLRKTAALISAACECGALAAGANDDDRQRYRDMGETLGLAFQIVDDILDVTADTETLGKTAGKDVEQNKVTYPSVVGLELSRKMADALADQVREAVAPEGPRAAALNELIASCVKRDH